LDVVVATVLVLRQALCALPDVKNISRDHDVVVTLESFVVVLFWVLPQLIRYNNDNNCCCANPVVVLLVVLLFVCQILVEFVLLLPVVVTLVAGRGGITGNDGTNGSNIVIGAFLGDAVVVLMLLLCCNCAWTLSTVNKYATTSNRNRDLTMIP
jgi:hypothetical protein